MPTSPNNSMNFLAPPAVEHKVFTRNFISGSIVELRFPTIISFDEALASIFAKKVRKQFPNFSKSYSASFVDSGISPGKTSFSFSSRKRGGSTISLHDSSLNIRISEYESYEKFRRIVSDILEGLDTILDTDFYTRIGYRIINAVPIPTGENIASYINPVLIAPLQFDVLGTLVSSRFEIRGLVSDGNHYIFKYGSPDDQTALYDKDGKLQFMLDYDYFIEDVDKVNRLNCLDYFHDQHFNFFWWTLNEKAKEYLEAEV